MARIRLNKEDRKEQIKAAAMELFETKGFKETSMEDILNKVGISKGGLYHHYKSKLDIFFALMEDATAYREVLVIDYLNKHKAVKREDLIIELLLDKLLDKNKFKVIYSIFLMELNRDNSFKELYEKIVDRSTDRFIEFCKEQGLEEYVNLTDKNFLVFMNSILVGTFIMQDYDEEKLREILSIMLKAYIYKT